MLKRMKRQTLGLLFSISYLFIPLSQVTAQDPAAYTTMGKELEDLISRKMESDNLVGVSAAFILDDSVIWKKGFGYADTEKGVRMTENTVLNIESVTKTFTALAIMQLLEQGKLDINQPLNAYLPQFRPRTRGEDLDRLTVRTVITHSSGIQTDILKNSDFATGKYTDVLGFINETYLLYPPGLVESYSNSGYNILGHLIKEVSNLDYPDYIRQNIFIPLGMDHSGFFMDSLQNKTRVYAGGKSMHEYGFGFIASGGIYTSLNDFILYAQGLMHAWNGVYTSLIGTSTIREMFTLRTGDVLVESNKKGLGWFMFANDSLFAVTHAGDAVWGHSVLILVPEKKAAAMILINSAEGESLKNDFSNIFIHHIGLSFPDIIAPKVIRKTSTEIKPIILPDDVLQKHAGIYSQGFGYVSVSAEGDNLSIDNNNKTYVLKALSESEFVPCERSTRDTLIEKSDERYCFMDSCGFHMLFHEAGKNETRLGYKLNPFDTSMFREMLGEYEHFGYQLIVGDTQFKGAELSLSDEGVLMLKLIAYDGAFGFPLNVISNEYAITSGLGVGFGFTVKFTEDESYRVIDFGGITFRNRK
jgi:CubicO group peptidase (beta-lactamase class C family)